MVMLLLLLFNLSCYAVVAAVSKEKEGTKERSVIESED